jgi:hypothetical protein
LLKSGMSLAEVGGIMGKMNQAFTVQHWTLCILSICGFFLSGGLLGTIDLQIPRVY